MSTILDKIIDSKKNELDVLKSEKPLNDVIAACRDAEPTRGFASAIESCEGPAIIAELKKASPTKGLLCPDFSVEKLAAAYAAHGAAAMSVLTEKTFFLGDLSYIAIAKSFSALPALRKDFIVDPYQVYEARAAGADAILLIVAALDKHLLADFLGLAHELSMDALVEVHDGLELETAAALPCDVIGVNNRNLKNGEVSIGRSIDLIGGIPAGSCKISESGIRSGQDIRTLYDAGYDGFLIGESLVASDDPGRTLANFLKTTG